MEQQISLSAHRLCIAAGPFLAVLFCGGYFLGAKWLPAPSPMLAPEQVSAMFEANRLGFQLGFVAMIIGGALIAPWGVAMTMWTRKTESRFPIMTYTQLTLIGAGVAIFVLCYMPWGVAVFRAGSVSPEIIQVLNDFGWFLFLFSVAPFSLWLAAFGVAILWNPPQHQMLPRWVGYLALLDALAITPALFIIFFKDGPYAYNGFLSLWWPFFEFASFIVVTSVMCWRALDRQVAIDESIGIGVHRYNEDLEKRELTAAALPLQLQRADNSPGATVISTQSLTV
ncbi:hypothetical protein ACWDTP_14320 [Mycobacterium sp. NPDC003449]